MDKELESLLNLSIYDKTLDSKFMELLYDLLKVPSLTAYDVHKKRSGRYRYYSSAKRDLDRLYDEFKLIEIAQEHYKPLDKNKGKDAKPFRLSINGIFYITINHVNNPFYDEIVLPLIKNYGSCVLFTHFLYPYVSRETLLGIEKLEVKDIIIYEPVFLYLKNICTTLVNSLKSLDSLIYNADENGFILEQIFMWPREDNLHNIKPFYEDELRAFLKSTFNWNQVTITPNYDQNTIHIKVNSESSIDISTNIRIVINEKENRAVLKQESKTLYEFIVTPNELFLSIDIRTKETKTEYLTKHLLDKCKDLPKKLLSDMRNLIDPSYRSYDLLMKDENFKKAIGKMDENIKIKA